MPPIWPRSWADAGARRVGSLFSLTIFIVPFMRLFLILATCAITIATVQLLPFTLGTNYADLRPGIFAKTAVDLFAFTFWANDVFTSLATAVIAKGAVDLFAFTFRA